MVITVPKNWVCRTQWMCILANVIDMPFGLSDLSKVFDVVDFLENKDQLLKDFTPEVKKLIVKKDFFSGPFLQAYEAAFDDLIVSLVRKQLTKHFNFSPEEIMLLTDQQFLKMIAEELFNQTNYLSKDDKNESKSTH